ncbi:MAG: DUF1801 domain-containing protein [Thermoplasmata archaeon]
MVSRRNDPRVDAYIARAPASVRLKLVALRRSIRQALPGAEETFSYGMPGYSYPGYPGQGMVAWFALRSAHIGLYVRLRTISDHRAALKGYVTTKSAVQIPIDKPVPARLVQKLVRASDRIMRE